MAEVREIYEAYAEKLGYVPNSIPREMAAAKKMEDYDIADILACYDHFKADSWWAAKHLSLTYIAQNIAAWKQTQSPKMDDEEMEAWFRANNPTLE